LSILRRGSDKLSERKEKTETGVEKGKEGAKCKKKEKLAWKCRMRSDFARAYGREKSIEKSRRRKGK